ncbi:MAG TPA: tetratricopeptide repeat protein, partial [Phycisphaeraceae bacterium]
EPLLEEARRIARQAPDFAPARAFLGKILLFHGHVQEALAEFEASLALNPDQPAVHLAAGTIALKLNQLDQARQHYAQAVRLDPANSQYRLHLAQSCLRQNHDDEARRVLEEALRLDASLHAAHAMLAGLDAKQNQVQQALEQIKRAIDLVPAQDLNTRVAYVRQRAALLCRINQPEVALAVLRELPPAKQWDPGVMEDLARCWDLMGHPERAAAHYELAVRLDPTNDLAALASARWYLEAGQPQDARRMAEALRRINPRCPDLPELLSRLEQMEKQAAASREEQR